MNVFNFFVFQDKLRILIKKKFKKILTASSNLEECIYLGINFFSRDL